MTDYETHSIGLGSVEAPQYVSLLLVLTTLCFGSWHAVAQSERDGTWVLQQGRGLSNAEVHGPSIKLQDRSLSGTTGCNAFTATISKVAQGVKIENISMTRKLCAPGRNEAERAFIRALEETAFLEMVPQRLTFLSGTREPLLVWSKSNYPTEPRSG